MREEVDALQPDRLQERVGVLAHDHENGRQLLIGRPLAVPHKKLAELAGEPKKSGTHRQNGIMGEGKSGGPEAVEEGGCGQKMAKGGRQPYKV
jgi:hypothetical protein